MGLVSPDILFQRNGGSVLPAAQAGVNLNQQIQKGQQEQQTYQRNQDFLKALNEVVPQVDYKTPEGQTTLVQELGKRGFGAEAMDLAKMFPKPATKTYQSVETDQGMAPFDTDTGTYGTPAVGPNGQPLKKPVKPEASRFQLVKNKKGVMESADVSTGLNPQGQPVEAWNEPNKPLGGAVMLGGYLRDWSKSKFDYEKGAKPYLALKAIKDSPSYGTGIGDQSMIDKLIIIETGRVPTEAQYFQFAHNLGIEDKIDRVTGKLKSGAILGPEARKLMEDQADEQMVSMHDAYKTDSEQFSAMAKDAGVDPAKVMRQGGYFSEVEKRLAKKAAKASTAPGAAAHPQDDAMVKWAKENPTAPGAAEVLKANGL